jgi:uncharacterized repeat protein (TIGR01451 family)
VALVSPGAADGSTLTDRATVTSTATDADSTNNTATFGTTAGAAAALAVRKAGPAAADGTYALTLTNSGPGDAQSVTPSDAVPAGTTFVSLSQTSGPSFNLVPPAGGTGALSASAPALAAGATFTPVLKADAGGPRGSAISNTAGVTSGTADSDAANNSSTAAATVATLAGLAVPITGPAAVTAGTNVPYTIRVTNAGPGDARAVLLTDSLRAGLSFLSAGAGGGATASPPPSAPSPPAPARRSPRWPWPAPAPPRATPWPTTPHAGPRASLGVVGAPAPPTSSRPSARTTVVPLGPMLPAVVGRSRCSPFSAGQGARRDNNGRETAWGGGVPGPSLTMP